MVTTRKRTSTSSDCNEDIHESNQKRQRIVIQRHTEEPSVLSNDSVPHKDASNLASDDVPNQMEFDMKPMQVIFDYMSKEMMRLEAEKEECKKKYLEQKEIANRLSDQINDNHSLVTESSLVEELQTEITQRAQSPRNAAVLHPRYVQGLRQEMLVEQQRWDAHMALQMKKEKKLRLQQLERDIVTKMQRWTKDMEDSKLALYSDMEAYRTHVQSSYQDMLRELKLNKHGGESSSLGSILAAFGEQIDQPGFGSSRRCLNRCNCPF